MFFIRPCFILFCFACLFFSCKNNRNKEGVENAMTQYDHLIKKLDADSIALLYTTDGNLGDVAHGRDSIKKFLASFKKIRVLSQVSQTKSIELSGDSALQKGTYQQADVMNEKDTIKVKGEYTAHWLWIENAWHIKSMMTQSTN